MALYNLIGHRRCHDIIDTVPLLALCVNVFCFNFSAYIRLFVNVLIEMNVNIRNEFNFSDVCRSVNYIGSLAKFKWTPLGLIHFARDPM